MFLNLIFNRLKRLLDVNDLDILFDSSHIDSSNITATFKGNFSCMMLLKSMGENNNIGKELQPK